MNILMVASEGVPFIKTGGLADVIGSLPKALQHEGCDIRVILPKYGTIIEEFKDQMNFLCSFPVMVGWRKQHCGLFELKFNGIHYYFIDNEYYFNRERIYDFFDEAERFAYFCFAVLEATQHMDFQPEILHCHDWQASLVPVFLKSHYLQQAPYSNMKTVLTIHNLKYQGIFPEVILSDILGLGYEHFTPDSLESNGCVNYLKGGILYSDVVNTVSSTYAEEIKHVFYGEGLEAVIAKKGIQGIVNGIDYDLYNPMGDSNIQFHYKTSLAKKLKNKEELQKQLNLPINQATPMIAIVSRLVEQKGFDLLAPIIHQVLAEDIQLVVLGTGEKKYEDFFLQAMHIYPEKVSTKLYFNEALAMQIYAGADLFLMPSKFEPCGLSQLIALRYGNIPIVRETGGLKDTVQPFNEFEQTGNGFTFTNYNAHDMLHTIQRALSIYKNQVQWANLVKNAVKQDYSWSNAAKHYKNLYLQL
ncbi:starch synthase [Desulfuribacillus stibiiarsenatis]|uniref:Glycogen synthase n=1 Tax=Desulfuribacillus stibiiarsenatis TaxID=1390249 RepID=A0A1E5L3F9_9FIRM|nr:glycogen synthase GlgA [Desulfuribacillus stibiiarsenatis]OEH84616.1 starch synthase [Desulfuribacillus stibiiarsenatis]